VERTDILVRYRIDRSSLDWLEERAKHHNQTLQEFLSSCLDEGINCEEERSSYEKDGED
jgi:hypothetical protein